MNSKKIFEMFELLQELTTGKEIVMSDYAAQKELSERTLRRYFEDLRSFLEKTPSSRQREVVTLLSTKSFLIMLFCQV